MQHPTCQGADFVVQVLPMHKGMQLDCEFKCCVTYLLQVLVHFYLKKEFHRTTSPEFLTMENEKRRFSISMSSWNYELSSAIVLLLNTLDEQAKPLPVIDIVYKLLTQRVLDFIIQFDNWVVWNGLVCGCCY